MFYKQYTCTYILKYNFLPHIVYDKLLPNEILIFENHKNSLLIVIETRLKPHQKIALKISNDNWIEMTK